MNRPALNHSVFRSICGFFVIVFPLLTLPLVSRGQLPSSGFPVSNPDWQILLTDWGYADLAFDLRPGFVGREYLSGEWAATVFYMGGQNPAQPIWFQPQWFYPDWVSDSDFGADTPFVSTGTNNASGFKVYRSVITNADLRIEMTYEMIDTTTGIAQGTTAKSMGETGSSITSDRYIFRETYRITNISGGPLTNFKFYQFLHGLETGVSLFDDRMYAGLPMSNYHYDNTQQGQSYGFDSRTGEIVLHHDTIAFHAMMTPDAWEVGYYGKKGVDNHVVGKPSIGVHLKVEADNLDTNIDYFAPPETRWVSGAQRFPLGTLAAGATVSIDMLLTVQTTDEVAYPPVNIISHNLQMTSSNVFIIDFEETTANPVVGFVLRKSTNVDLTPLSSWEQVVIPRYINVPQAGWSRFYAPVDPTLPRCFYAIEPVIQQ